MEVDVIMAIDAPNVTIDILEGARWVEEPGGVKEISRLALASGFQPGGGLGGVGEIIIALALNHTDMPKRGDEHPIETGLVLANRFAIVRDTGVVQVELRYKVPGLIDQPPPGEPWTLRGGASLEEIETQIDRDGNQITVSHNDKTQGGVIRPLMPRRELHAEWTNQSMFPGALVDAYVGKTNLSEWQGGPPGTWLCTELTFDPANVDKTPVLYRFNGSFRQKDDDGSGHNPQVVFIDPETGQPPTGLVAGVGFKTIPWYLFAEFNALP